MNELNGFKDTTEKMGNKLSECKLASLAGCIIAPYPWERPKEFGHPELAIGPVQPVYGDFYDKPIIKICMEAIKNKLDGLQREKEVEAELKKQYPPEKGYSIVSEAYLRDKNGNIVKDPVTGEARRIDFVVVKDGKVVDSIEVTSKTANKTDQTAKEERIRKAGGNYIRTYDGKLVEIPTKVSTRIERRD